MTDINALIGKPYDHVSYHCWHFIEEVLPVPKLENVHADCAKADVDKYTELFNEIQFPTDYCIVLLGDTHVGIWYNNGIYHNDKSGVRYESYRVMKLKYKGFKWYSLKQTY